MNEQIQKWYGLPALELILIEVSILFILVSTCLVLFLLISRAIKNRNEKRRSILRSNFQEILNQIIFQESFSKPDEVIPSFEFRVDELRSHLGQSKFAKQVLIDQLLELKKNLTGISAEALVATYRKLDLHLFSVAKFKGLQWKRKGQALRELAEINYQEAIVPITRLLKSNRRTLREESAVALMRLRSEEPLSFLHSYSGAISPWMEINIHHHLLALDHRKIPQFSQWFDNPNVSVSLLCIKMAQLFRQASSLPALVSVLRNPNQEVAGQAAEALGEMEAYPYANEVATLAASVWDKKNVTLQVIKCLGKIGVDEKHSSLLKKFLSHPSYEVQFEAARNLISLGQEGRSLVQLFSDQEGQSFRGVMDHLSEPLLQ
jgi:HEAT repeat protein